MIKILVTGGTGLVGAHLLYYLVKNGCSPTAIKRKKSDLGNVEKIFNYYSDNGTNLFNQIIWEECDILDFLKLEEIVKNTTHIYHCAALISFNNSLKDEMLEINTTGTSNIVDLSLKYSIKRICYVSSIATLGSNNELSVNEDCFWNWDNQSGYAVSKYLAEMEVFRGFAEGLSGVIVNPSLIIGPGSWHTGIGTIINKCKIGSPFYPAGGCGLIDVNDLVKIMIKLMNSDITNERFIINSEHMSYKKLMTIVTKKLNKRPPSIKLNSTIMKVFILIDILWNKIRGHKIELSTDAVKYTTNNIILDSKKINQMIKFSYKDMSTSLNECLDIFMKEQLKR